MTKDEFKEHLKLLVVDTMILASLAWVVIGGKVAIKNET